MSILTVVASELDARELVVWGYRLAVCQKSPLVLCCFPDNSNSNDQTIRSLAEKAIAAVPTPEDVAPPTVTFCECPEMLSEVEVLEHIKEHSASMVVLRAHSNQRDGLASDVFHLAPCSVFTVAIDEEDEWQGPRILVPVGSTPYVSEALKIGYSIAECFDGLLCPAYVQPDVGEDSEGIGREQIDRELTRARIPSTDFVQPKVIIANSLAKGLKTVTREEFDLILFSTPYASSLRRLLTGGVVPKELSHGPFGVAVGALRGPRPFRARARNRIENALRMGIPQLTREERTHLSVSMERGSRLRTDFVVLILLSTCMASIGLLQNNGGVVIGAMLVAPLMIPVLGAGLSLSQANVPLLKRSAESITIGFVLALGVAVLIGMIWPNSIITDQIRARSTPTLFDMILAFVAGAAAAYCSGRSMLSAALPGVAISASLVPPIAAAGVCLATGHIPLALGAAKLFATNVVAIALGVSFTLFCCGIRPSPNQTRGIQWMRYAHASLFVALILLGVLLVDRKSSGPSPRFPDVTSYEAAKNRIESVLSEVGGRVITLEPTGVVVEAGGILSNDIVRAIRRVLRSRLGELSNSDSIRVETRLVTTVPLIAEHPVILAPEEVAENE